MLAVTLSAEMAVMLMDNAYALLTASMDVTKTAPVKPLKIAKTVLTLMVLANVPNNARMGVILLGRAVYAKPHARQTNAMKVANDVYAVRVQKVPAAMS